VSDRPGRQPRWDPDERGIGVGDARSQLELLDALRGVADRAGWVAEAPESHLLPALLAHLHAGAPWLIEATATTPDGTFEVALRWTGPPDPDRRTIRAAAYGLLGAVAEGATVIHEHRGPDGLVFDVMTGVLPGETAFATHGHTIRLRVAEAP
jgi:hypothetical protein